MMSILMGARTPRILARACDLGVAMQLTNIARDVGEDARAGRLYLPLQWLRSAGIDPEAWLARPVFSAALGAVVQRLLDAADGLYARSTPVSLDYRSRVVPGSMRHGCSTPKSVAKSSAAAVIQFRAAPWCPGGARRCCSRGPSQRSARRSSAMARQRLRKRNIWLTRWLRRRCRGRCAVIAQAANSTGLLAAWSGSSIFSSSLSVANNLAAPVPNRGGAR